VNHTDIPAFVDINGRTTGRAGENKELSLAHANLIWSPVAFVDIGIEGGWGHRVVATNLKGDMWALQTALRFRF